MGSDKKCLIVSTVSKQFTLFEKANIETLKSLGYKIYGASNFSNDDNNNTDFEKLKIEKININIQRSPYSIKNIKAYFKLKKVIKEGKFDLIHCHSPMGGVLTRLAARKLRKNGLRVIYTAHGFHFFKGAPLFNFLVYFNIEKWLSKYTDTLITINKEDYKRAKRKFRKCKDIRLVPGIRNRF